MKILLFVFGMALGSYLLLPFLAIYLVQEIGLSYLDLSILLTIKLFMQRFGATLNIITIKFLSFSLNVILGISLRILALVLLLKATTMLGLAAAMVMLGISSSIYIPTCKTLLLTTIKRENVASTLSKFNICRNLGVACGAGLGSVLLIYDFETVILTSIGIYLAAIVIVCISFPKANASTTKDAAESSSFSSLPKIRSLVPIFVAATTFGLCYSQLEFAIPVFVNAAYSPHNLSYLLGINTILILLFQNVLTKHIVSNSNFKQLGIYFYILVILMFVFSSLPYNFVFLIFSISWFTFAEMLILVAIDKQLSDIYTTKNLTAAFSIVEITIGIGTCIGYIISSIAFNSYSEQIGFVLNNLIITCIVFAALAATIFVPHKSKP